MYNVLIVEDDPMVAEFNKRYLQQVPGFKAVAAVCGGEAALAQLALQPVDLVLLDIYMPGMNGLQLLAQLRAEGNGVDVIVVSAASDSHSIKQALLHGAADYIVKPFDFTRLSLALNQYSERRKCLEQGQMSQEDIDRQVLHRAAKVSSELPKGLDRNTLQTIWRSIRQVNGSFTTEQLAQQVGISRVSMRKYLEFLQKLEVIRLDICYGAVGRPTYKYHCINAQADVDSL